MTGFVSKRIVHTLAVLLIGASAVPGGGVAATFRHPPQAPATSQVRSSTLYVSSYQNSTVTEYRLPGGTAIGALGTSAGIYNPGGLFFAKGQLYVPTGPYVLIFPAGSSKPSMRLQETDISGDFGGDVTVGKDGTVYDVNLVNDACGVGDFEVFLKGQTSPAYTVNMEFHLGGPRRERRSVRRILSRNEGSHHRVRARRADRQERAVAHQEPGRHRVRPERRSRCRRWYENRGVRTRQPRTGPNVRRAEVWAVPRVRQDGDGALRRGFGSESGRRVRLRLGNVDRVHQFARPNRCRGRSACAAAVSVALRVRVSSYPTATREMEGHAAWEFAARVIVLRVPALRTPSFHW